MPVLLHVTCAQQAEAGGNECFPLQLLFISWEVGPKNCFACVNAVLATDLPRGKSVPRTVWHVSTLGQSQLPTHPHA
ncbi:MAG: hypothetical protein ACK56F_10145, partial [bacterium]